MKLFLIGLMGSGKTYWAEKLKTKYKIAAYDLDNLVEIMQEKTVAEIFADDGEEAFRKEEAKMLRLFKEKKQFILSCGGGTPCFNDNITWMNKNGVTIWLDEPIELLAERLKKEKEHRPLINKTKDEELIPFLTNMLEARAPYYKQATYHLRGERLNDKSFDKIFKEHA